METDEDYKRMRSEDKHPEEQPDALDPCVLCGEQDWRLEETTTYGDDADGRRGVLVRLYVCGHCQAEQQVTG